MARRHLFISPMLEFLGDQFLGQPHSWFLLMIYANATTLYSGLGKSVFFEKVESAGELELDMRSIVEWGDRCLVTFNATKTKLIYFGACGDEWH